MNNKIYGAQGMYSFVGLLIGFLLVTLQYGVSYGSLLSDFFQFITFQSTNVVDGTQEHFLTRIVTLLAIILLDIVLALVIGNGISLLLGKSKSFARDSVDDLLDRGSIPLFTIVLLEELFARYIPLGILNRWLDGDVWTYILIIAFNLIWALIHLSNFSKSEDRSVLRVLPQFVGGFILAYVFLRYGFLLTVLTHFVFNVTLLSTRKEQPVKQSDVHLTGFYAILGLILAILTVNLNLSITDFSTWLDGTFEPISGYGFWQYVVVLLLISCICNVIAGILLLDRSTVNLKASEPIYTFLGPPITLLIVLLCNWVGNYFLDDPIAAAITGTILLTLLSATQSGSALARVWLALTPSFFLSLAALNAVGFWTALGMTYVFLIIGYIPMLIQLNGNSLARAEARI